MQYPTLLEPTANENLKLPCGAVTQVPKTYVVFNSWAGEPIPDTYGDKPILNFAGKPAFAELAVLKAFQSDGWNGVWVDTYRTKFRTEYWPRNEVPLPDRQHNLLRQIYAQAGSEKGCWDVFCWKDDQPLFAEVKRKGRDKVRQSQLRWLESALNHGLPLATFLIVEWSEAPLKNSAGEPIAAADAATPRGNWPVFVTNGKGVSHRIVRLFG